MQETGIRTRPEIEAALKEALSDSRFKRGEPLLMKWIEQFLEWLDEVFSVTPEGTGEFLGTVSYILLIVVLVVAVVLLTIMMLRLRGEGPERDGWPAAQQELARKVMLRVEELRERALEAERRGDFLAAMRLYFFALVVGLGQQGDLEYREAWTNRELFVRGNPSPEVEATLRPVLGELDEKSFGDREVGPEDVAVFSRLLDRWVKERQA